MEKWWLFENMFAVCEDCYFPMADSGALAKEIDIDDYAVEHTTRLYPSEAQNDELCECCGKPHPVNQDFSFLEQAE